MGCAENTVYRWECGRSMPSGEALAGISRACDVSVDWLLGMNEHAKGAAQGAAPEKAGAAE